MLATVIAVICILMLFVALFLAVGAYYEKGPAKGLNIAVLLVICALLLPHLTEIFH